jgi:hypothetical protein
MVSGGESRNIIMTCVHKTRNRKRHYISRKDWVRFRLMIIMKSNSIFLVDFRKECKEGRVLYPLEMRLSTTRGKLFSRRGSGIKSISRWQASYFFPPLPYTFISKYIRIYQKGGEWDQWFIDIHTKPSPYSLLYEMSKAAWETYGAI